MTWYILLADASDEVDIPTRDFTELYPDPSWRGFCSTPFTAVKFCEIKHKSEWFHD